MTETRKFTSVKTEKVTENRKIRRRHGIKTENEKDTC